MVTILSFAFLLLLHGVFMTEDLPYDVKVFENAIVGDILFSTSVTNCNVTGEFIDSILQQEQHFQFNDSNCLVIKTPDLDNNSDSKLCERGGLVLHITCDIGDFKRPLVRVQSVDEFPPEFKKLDYNAKIFEGKPSGTTVMDFTSEVTDTDCKDTSFVYRIEEHTATGAFSINKGLLTTSAVLDYEAGPVLYNLTVYAENDPNKNSGGIQNTSVTLLVDIQDIDDMNPIFSHPAYTLQVKEEDSSTISIDLWTSPRIHAYDQDFGINQTVIYSLMDSASVGNFISINDYDGSLQLNDTLDREDREEYEFTIKAEQNDSSQRFAISKLKLTVEDINDNHALFKQHTMANKIQENLAIGGYVTIVQATDLDTGDNAKFNYSIYGDIFSIDPTSGVIKVKNSSALDRESLDIFTMQVSTIPDNPVVSNAPCTFCNLTLKITLGDENDNDPIFTHPNGYTFSIRENVANEIVGQVNATDKDLDENAMIRYSIDGSPGSFEISTDSGVITLTAPSTIPINILVKACDSPVLASLRRCSVVYVKVVKADNTTVQGHDFSAELSENQPKDTIVTSIPYYSNQFNFKFEQVQDFYLEKGLIKTKVSLNRERQHDYSLQLQLFNGSTLINAYTVNISVIDVNDNHPIFRKRVYTFSLEDGLKEGSVIGTVMADDADEGSNANVTYYIEGQSPEYFAIGAYNGEITMVSFPVLTFAQQFIPLVIKASDSGQPSLQTLADVKVTVGNNNDTLRIYVGAHKDRINKEKSSLEQAMSDILGVHTTIRNTTSYGDGSVIFISATNRTDESKITVIVLNSRVNDNMPAIQQLFMKKQTVMPTTSSNKFSTEALALVIVACVVLFGSIFLIGVTCYKYKRYQRLQRLVHTLSRKNSIYETQETTIAIEDEVSNSVDNDDSVSNQRLIPNEAIPNGHAVGVVNEGYVSDQPEHVSNVSEVTSQQNIVESSGPVRDYEHVTDDIPQETADEITIGSDEPVDEYEQVINRIEPEQDYEQETDETASQLLKTPSADSVSGPIQTEELPTQSATSIPVAPPLPEVFNPTFKSSSGSDLVAVSASKPSTSDLSKHVQYENVLLELQAAVNNKKSANCDEDDEKAAEISKHPQYENVQASVNNNKTVDCDDENLTIKFGNWSENLEVVDQSQMVKEKQFPNNDSDANSVTSENELNEPDEPEPDYAKRVTFSESKTVVPDLPVKSVDKDDSDGDSPEMVQGWRSEEIHSPQECLNGESGTFVFGGLEITEM